MPQGKFESHGTAVGQLYADKARGNVGYGLETAVSRGNEGQNRPPPIQNLGTESQKRVSFLERG